MNSNSNSSARHSSGLSSSPFLVSRSLLFLIAPACALLLFFSQLSVNVEDQKDQLIVTAEVPGFDKENLKVNISDDNVLTICGEQKKEHIEQSKDKKYVSSHRRKARAARIGRPGGGAKVRDCSTSD